MNHKQFVALFCTVVCFRFSKEFGQTIIDALDLERPDKNYPYDQIVIEEALKFRSNNPAIGYDLLKACLEHDNCLSWWNTETLANYSKMVLGEVYTDPKVLANALEDRYQTLLHNTVYDSFGFNKWNPAKTVLASWLLVCYPEGFHRGRWNPITRPAGYLDGLSFTQGLLEDHLDNHPYLVYEYYVLLRSLGFKITHSRADIEFTLNKIHEEPTAAGISFKALFSTLANGYYKTNPDRPLHEGAR